MGRRARRRIRRSARTVVAEDAARHAVLEAKFGNGALGFVGCRGADLQGISAEAARQSDTPADRSRGP